jgi:hypothetical protein
MDLDDYFETKQLLYILVHLENMNSIDENNDNKQHVFFFIENKI